MNAQTGVQVLDGCELTGPHHPRPGVRGSATVETVCVLSQPTSSKESDVQFRQHGSPVVSVIMGAYNCADTLTAAIEAIRNQSMRDWELIVCDDGSSDGTADVALRHAESDVRVRVVQNEANLGLAPTLNRCMRLATAPIIARMDGDDVCSPDRLQRQCAYLAASPEVDFLGTAVLYFDDEGVWGRSSPKREPRARNYAFGNPYAHGSMMFRRSAVEAVGGYSEDDRHWRVEDYDLWSRLQAAGYRGHNLPDVLYGLRNDRAAAQRRSPKARRNEAKVMADIVQRQQLPRVFQVLAGKPLILSMLPSAAYETIYRRKHGGTKSAASNHESPPWVDRGRMKPTVG